eukprot:UN02288
MPSLEDIKTVSSSSSDSSSDSSDSSDTNNGNKMKLGNAASAQPFPHRRKTPIRYMSHQARTVPTNIAKSHIRAQSLAQYTKRAKLRKLKTLPNLFDRTKLENMVKI